MHGTGAQQGFCNERMVNCNKRYAHFWSYEDALMGMKGGVEVGGNSHNSRFCFWIAFIFGNAHCTSKYKNGFSAADVANGRMCFGLQRKFC